MKRPGELDVAAQIEWARARRERLAAWSFRCIFGIAAALGALAAWASIEHAPGPDPLLPGFRSVSSGVVYTFPIMGVIDEAPTRYAPVTDVALREAFHAAVKAWKKALGGELPISYPRLVQSERGGYCEAAQVIAWADDQSNRVVLLQAVQR